MGRLLDIQLRAGTAAAWTATNPTLDANEPGYETDTGKLKFGDGATAWASLPYFVLAGANTWTGTNTYSGAMVLSNLLRISPAGTKTSNTTLTTATPSSQVCDATSGSFTMTLFSTTTAGYTVMLTKIDSTANTVTVAATSWLSGEPNPVLRAAGDFVLVQATGTTGQWKVLASHLSLQPGLLASVSGINAKTTGITPIFTVPTGRSAVITGAAIRCIAATAISAAATVSLGITASAYADIFAATSLAGVTAAAKAWLFNASGAVTIQAAGAVIEHNISVAATGTSQTFTVDLFGYLI